jgi:transposase
MHSDIVLGLPQYEITDIDRDAGMVRIFARYTGRISCPHCDSTNLRNRGAYFRSVRHETWGMRPCILELEAHKWRCRSCDRQFRQRFPGLLKGQHGTEAFRRMIFFRHWDGISRRRLAERERIGSATVERHFLYYLGRLAAERSNAVCPRILGIDEHFFSRRQGYATTLCDLEHHKVFDVVLGRSEASLESYFNNLQGKDRVEVVCMDLASCYRALVRKHFPKAVIVADRFHVIRLLNHHFLSLWKQLDATGSKNRGLVSLMRRHAKNLTPEQRPKLQAYLAELPALAAVYQFKQRLCNLLLTKHRTVQQCRQLAPRLLRAIADLRTSGFAALRTLGETFASWSEEIARMWRYTRNNGITEGFHTKMEVLQRQSYGFRNFQSYRLRVKVMCS